MASGISLTPDTSLEPDVPFAQDVIRCSLCENAVEYHCNFCEIRLCSGCTSIHLSDKSKTHEVVAFTSRKLSEIIPECSTHGKSKCEIFCRDCEIPICAKCVVSVHRQHNFSEMEEFLDEKRAEILDEIKETEAKLLPQIQKQKCTIHDAGYENAIEEIFRMEDEICSAVRNFGSKLRESVTQHKMENQDKANKIKFTQQTLLNSMQEAKAIVQSNDSKAILQYRGMKTVTEDALEVLNEYTPQVEVKCLQEEDIAPLFGRLVFKSCIEDEKTVENTALALRGNVEEEVWFHGFIPREEAELLLQKDGDFLVRESDNGGEHCFVVSSIRKDPVHAIITPESIIKHLGRKGTVVEFMKHLRCSSANLLNPIQRQNSQLDYDKISIGSHLEETQMPKRRVLCQGTYNAKSVLIKWGDGEEKGVFKNLNFLRQFKHRNIVDLIGFSALRKPALLVMEDLSGGSLLNYLRKNGSDISVKKKMEMCGDVASGMAYLQQKKCIHRDVAARNCLVSADTMVKISDFWMAEIGGKVNNSGMPLPIKWTAPEALGSGFSTSLSDVWSFGILMWEIFSSGQLPYTGMNNNETMENIQKGYRMPAPDGTPNACYNLMLRCWSLNPSDRHNFDEIVYKIQKVIKDIK